MGREELKRAIIREAVGVLDGSERGRRVAVQLRAFLEGDFASADERTARAVFALLNAYRGGFPGSVMDELRGVACEGVRA